MPEVNPATKSTCDESQKPLAGDALAGEMKGVMNQPEKPVGRKRSGKRAAAGKVRDREAEKANRIANCGLTIGRCGKVAEQARRNVGIFRRVLSQSVLHARGVVSIPDCLAINTAARWELAAQMATAWLRRDEEKLSAAERLAHSTAIANAATQRDKAVERLRLPGSTAEACGKTTADFYASLTKQIEQQPEDPTPPEPTES